MRLVLMALAVVCLGGCVADPGEIRQSADSTSSHASIEPSPAWTIPPVPTTVDGREVRSVSAAIAARDAGRLGGATVLIGGYWSVRPFPASCPAPMHTPGDLELRCQYGQGGITERYEAILVIRSDPSSLSARPPEGPSLVPWVPPALTGRLREALYRDPPYPPMPIVVAGHFDDPRATQCHPDLRQACRERLVIESVVRFDPASAPPPSPTPVPTPFPSPGPSGLFPVEQCAGDVPYSFVGWTTTDDLDTSADHDGHVWAAITRDVIPMGDWGTDPGGEMGRFSRGFGRRVCLTPEWIPGGMEFTVVNGTAYAQWDDGRRTSADAYGPESGDDTLPPAGSPPPLPRPIESELHGPGLAPVAASVRDWSGDLVDMRPATADELAAADGVAPPAGAQVLPGDPRALLIVWAECGSDSDAIVVVTHDRRTVLIKAPSRNECRDPGARRGGVLTFSTDVPIDVVAVGGM